MDRQPVESSNLVSVGYNAGSQILQVELKGGRLYNYFRVPREKYEALIAAESCGKYLNAEIKPHHGYELVDTNDATHALTQQQQLDMDGVMVGVSRQALDEVGRELHFLRHFYRVCQDHWASGMDPADFDIAADYADYFGWPAPTKYQPSTEMP